MPSITFFDTFSTHVSNLGMGGLHSYETITDRNDIHESRRFWGMFCYVYSTNKTYQLQYNYSNDVITNNSNWCEVSFGASGGGGGGSVTGLSSREVKSTTSGSLASNASSDVTASLYKSFLLQYVETSAPAWVRIYCDSSSRTSDSSRTMGNDPVPGNGLLCEVITETGTLKQLVTPGVLCFNNDSTPSNNIYVSIKNLDASSQDITVNFCLVKLEA